MSVPTVCGLFKRSDGIINIALLDHSIVLRVLPSGKCARRGDTNSIVTTARLVRNISSGKIPTGSNSNSVCWSRYTPICTSTRITRRNIH